MFAYGPTFGRVSQTYMDPEFHWFFNAIVSFQGNIGSHNGRNRVFCLQTSMINCSVGPTTNHQI